MSLPALILGLMQVAICLLYTLAKDFFLVQLEAMHDRPKPVGSRNF